MCTAGNWIHFVTIHLSDQRSSFDQESYIPILGHDLRSKINPWIDKNQLYSLNNLLLSNFIQSICFETFIYLLKTRTAKVLTLQILELVCGKRSLLCLAFKTLNKWKQLFCYFILAVYPLKSQNMDESLLINISMRHSYVFMQLMNFNLGINHHDESNANICQYFRFTIKDKTLL